MIDEKNELIPVEITSASYITITVKYESCLDMTEKRIKNI